MTGDIISKNTDEDRTIPKPGVDDEDDEDDDYNPDDDEEEDEDEGNSPTATDNEPKLPTCNLSHSKLVVVDEAFESLFGYKYGTRFIPLKTSKRKRSQLPLPLFKEEQVLESLFGPITASRMMKTRDFVTKSSTERDITATTSSKEEEMVTELKHYAGKVIAVKSKKKRVEKGGKNKGIDSLLEELNGPSKLSTVAKTSSDWDTFKTETGMEEELEQKAQGKEAYLHKQDFLNRVDHRRFVEEKQKRDDDRRKRGK